MKNDHRSLFSSCLNWKINCDDHSSPSSTTAVQISMNYFIYTSHHIHVVFYYGKHTRRLCYWNNHFWLVGSLCYIGEKPFLVCLVDEHFKASLKKVEIICAITWCDCSLGKD